MLELREYETRRVPLSPADAVELAAFTRGGLRDEADDAPKVVQAILPTSVDGHYDVQAGPYVGRFTLRTGLTVDITSRFPFVDLLEVLRIAQRLPALLQDAPVPAAPGSGLVDLVAVAFAREVRRLAGAGLAKGYVKRTFSRPPYPGAPDVNAHLARHVGRPDRLITTAKRLTVDIPANQVLASALDILRRQRYRDPTLTVSLRSLAPALSQVTRVTDPAGAARVAAPGLPVRYRPAVALALLVLRGRTALPAGSGVIGASVLFAMPAVWEAYVESRLAEQLPAGHRLLAQYPVALTDTGPPMTAHADLVQVDSAQVPVAVFDAKYKWWSTQPQAGDLYQMVTYAQRLGVSQATLVHPGRGQQSEVVVGQLRIAVCGLDVLQHPPVADLGTPVAVVET